MPARSLGAIAAAISRHTEGLIPFGEIYDAINNANQDLHNKYEWPWTYATAQLSVKATYNTGTITVLDGSSNVTGTGTAWDTTWQYKSLLIGSTYYSILSVNSPTSISLVSPVNQGQDFVDSGYTIFQEIYPLPDDCEFGKIVLIANPTYRYRLNYLPTYTLERQNIYLPGFFNNFQTGFCDAGYHFLTNKWIIKMTPPPSAAMDYRIVYRIKAPDLTRTDSLAILPNSFDRVLELMAEYQVRFARKKPMPGWMELKEEARQALLTMRRTMATSMYDNKAMFSTYPNSDNVSFFDGRGGVFVGPTGP